MSRTTCRFAGRPQQPALPAVPVLVGLRGVLQPQLPAGGGSPPQLEPGAGGGAGGAAGAARPAPGPARLRPVRAAHPGALLRRLHPAAGRGARHPAPAAQRPGPRLRRGRPGRRGAHQPRLPLHGRGRALLDPADHLLHPAGRLHAGGVPAEHGQGVGVPHRAGADGRPLHPPPHRGPMDRHPARLRVASGGALVPAPLRSPAGVLLAAGFCSAASHG